MDSKNDTDRSFNFKPLIPEPIGFRPIVPPGAGEEESKNNDASAPDTVDASVESSVITTYDAGSSDSSDGASSDEPDPQSDSSGNNSDDSSDPPQSESSDNDSSDSDSGAFAESRSEKMAERIRKLLERESNFRKQNMYDANGNRRSLRELIAMAKYSPIWGQLSDLERMTLSETPGV